MQQSAGLEVVAELPGVEPKRVAVYPDQGPQFWEPYKQRQTEKEPSIARHICGLKRTTFWILFAAALLIITAAALGGGLGGGLSHRAQNTEQQQTSNPSTSTTSTSSTSMSSTTSSAANPSVMAAVGTIDGQPVTLYRDCPSANDTQYSFQIDSTTYKFRKLCNMQAQVTQQHTAYVNQRTGSLNDCINLCATWNENNVTKSNAGQVCSSVCWRNGFENDDFPGQCFGYTGNNISAPGGFDLQVDNTCDSGIWVN
ncbi:hypothetical protein BGW36DRAFT_76062 [Talaromyces proteolyticus]|uniref:Uncharacterized protein n=1 Tax=Talaromyces proteolyticus TaxID=1131652 RepID=A0AAD4KDD0_9EURO|nr:uncharacterized protein BGW36DRAFT_76062 [Talaromyces proteolyticus]KAH8689005.1 hypothetical protein BGW36DRAFT_76062 [Talaromyces proteolyticus]